MDRHTSQKLAAELVHFFFKNQHTQKFVTSELETAKQLRHAADFEDLVNEIQQGSLSWFLFLKVRPHFVNTHSELYSTLLVLWLAQPAYSLIWDQLEKSQDVHQDLIALLNLLENSKGQHTLFNYWHYLVQTQNASYDDFDGFLFSHKFV